MCLRGFSLSHTELYDTHFLGNIDEITIYSTDKIRLAGKYIFKNPPKKVGLFIRTKLTTEVKKINF